MHEYTRISSSGQTESYMFQFVETQSDRKVMMVWVDVSEKGKEKETLSMSLYVFVNQRLLIKSTTVDALDNLRGATDQNLFMLAKKQPRKPRIID